MEYYKQINKELSINNQELRNVVQKLKLEITYINRQLLEQREETYRFKKAIAEAIEKKYHETMAVIYPENITEKLNVESRRRSFVNATAADPILNRTHSPSISSAPEDTDVKEDSISICKTPIPDIILEECSLNKQDSQSTLNYNETRNSECNLIYSASRRSEDLHTSESVADDLNYSEVSILEQTSRTSNSGLMTITEKSIGGNDSISESAINHFLDAPCSTPFNTQKQSNDSTFKPKQIRIMMKKISVEELARLSTQKNFSTLQKNNYPSNGTAFKTTKYNIEACHVLNHSTILKVEDLTRKNLSPQKNNYYSFQSTISNIEDSHTLKNSTTNNFTFKNSNKTFYDGESFAGTKVIANFKTDLKEETSKDRSIKRVKQKPKQNKENQDTDSEKIYVSSSDEESVNVLRRRLRNKQLSLKEPSLRTKLRNTTNIKF